MLVVVGMAVVAAGLVERWRDLGPELWLGAAGAAVVWLVLLGICAALTEPREVDPGPETLDLGGPESPAVVSLIADDWRLGHEALPATLLDLAARKHVEIDQVGDQTYVRVLTSSSATAVRPDALTTYEDMVLDHVRGLSTQGHDGRVPAEALTTGPDETSKGWWKRYRAAVEADARQRGLSRSRWSTGVVTLLTTTAAVVGLTVALAVSTAPTDYADSDTTSEDDDSNSVVAAIFTGLVSWMCLAGLVKTLGDRERDTPAGREAAARWLGLREMLAHNTLFAEQPPAGVAIWDRHIAYGAALGVAHGAVAALPLGAESDDTAWSSLGGRWRVVHIDYPVVIPPGYGRHPFRAVLVGLAQLVPAGWVLTRLPPIVRSALDDLGADGVDVATAPGTEVAVQVVLAIISAAAFLVALRGAWMLVAGLLDLVSGWRTVEGRVLRYRVRGTDDRRRWYMAVDDGTSNRVRAWRFHSVQQANQGATVRASVTCRLQHVKELTVAVTRNTDERTSAHEMTASGE